MTDFKNQDRHCNDNSMHVMKRGIHLVLVLVPAPNMTESKQALKENRNEAEFSVFLELFKD